MKYTMYILCEPGMDRPCFSHSPPSEEQKKRAAEKGTRVFAVDILIPGFELIDGQLGLVEAKPL